MEITNNSTHYSIPLVVGRRLAQIIFLDTDGALDGRAYSDTGKYQSSSLLADLQKSWSPMDMLPKLYSISYVLPLFDICGRYKDREVQ